MNANCAKATSLPSGSKIHPETGVLVDSITGTPLYTYDHPYLSQNAMRRIDRTVETWWQRSELLGVSADILMPCPAHRRRLSTCGKKLDEIMKAQNQQRERDAKPREACAVLLSLYPEFDVDARRANWRERLAGEIEAYAAKLHDLAQLIRECDGSADAHGDVDGLD